MTIKLINLQKTHGHETSFRLVLNISNIQKSSLHNKRDF